MPRTTSNPLLASNKNEAMERGRKLAANFHQILNTISNGVFPSHLYIYGRSGIGKSYAVKKLLYELGIEFLEIAGNTSMFAFGLKLAQLQHLRPSREPVVILVDDCDELLCSESNLNILKNVLSGARQFNYDKSLSSQWSQLNEGQKKAIKHFQGGLNMGFNVSVANLVFIFTSNTHLACDDEVQKLRESGRAKATLFAHRNAIRSRVRVLDLDFTDAELWGWISNIAMTEAFAPEIDEVAKMEILDFLWENWHLLKERSLRLVEKMASTMANNPENYKDIWEMEFIRMTTGA